MSSINKRANRKVTIFLNKVKRSTGGLNNVILRIHSSSWKRRNSLFNFLRKHFSLNYGKNYHLIAELFSLSRKILKMIFSVKLSGRGPRVAFF